jgi:hypothetical protein
MARQSWQAKEFGVVFALYCPDVTWLTAKPLLCVKS